MEVPLPHRGFYGLLEASSLKGPLHVPCRASLLHPSRRLNVVARVGYPRFVRDLADDPPTTALATGSAPCCRNYSSLAAAYARLVASFPPPPGGAPLLVTVGNEFNVRPLPSHSYPQWPIRTTQPRFTRTVPGAGSLAHTSLRPSPAHPAGLQRVALLRPCHHQHDRLSDGVRGRGLLP